MVAIEILKTIEQNPRITPLEMSKKLGINLQYIRNTLRTLTELKLVETPARGVYVLTELGRYILKQI
ncbi:MAG: winged helix-turn-helix transcriptional regulator [Nitrososphaerota archaeon]|nr:winged helix-turn-helix transcriptional regulator [Nitrososphaerota archaeon]